MKTRTKRSWSGALTLALACACGAPASDHEHSPRSRHPNVVLIMTDDQGYGDFSHAGHGALETPNLDRLAAESPKFERFYVSAVCSPTRASLMTGRWNYRTRVVDTWIGRSMMEPEEVTLAELFNQAGFATGIFGKWHLGDCYPMRPMDQGFEESLVHRGGGLAQPSEPPDNERRYSDPVLFRNGQRVDSRGYCTDVYFDAAREFIERSVAAERPFFAFVAPNAPHDPYHDVPEQEYLKYAGKDLLPALQGKGENVDREARICAMIENIDRNVGRLLADLERHGIERQTLVVFLCDNGPVWGRFTRGLRGSKSLPYEGGIRSPLFLRWPGRLEPTLEVDRIAAHIDLLPTLLSLTGVAAPPDVRLDGRDLTPLLGARAAAWPDRYLFLQTHRGNVPAREHHFAVVGQRWKLVRASGFGRAAPKTGHPFELYDLLEDPAESLDVSDSHPDVVAAMRRDYRTWFDDVSHTRPDNWSPPRIHVGSRAEPRTTLTKQDHRHAQGEGWDGDGAWWLRSAVALELDMTLLFRTPTRVDRARVRIGDQFLDRIVDATGSSLCVGPIPCPAGDFELSVDLFAGGKAVLVHQLELEPR